jgi:hypothetical protein
MKKAIWTNAVWLVIDAALIVLSHFKMDKPIVDYTAGTLVMTSLLLLLIWVSFFVHLHNLLRAFGHNGILSLEITSSEEEEKEN